MNQYHDLLERILADGPRGAADLYVGTEVRGRT